jgi:very-short-patch-repair endonuclease
VAAPGTLPALEAHMRSHSSAKLKSQARLEFFARQHRCAPTESEALLWSALKARQLGVSFRRQVPLAGLFIADFFVPSIGLVIEVDGAVHARRPGPDARRDLKLSRLGLRVIRISAELVLRDLPAAVAVVRSAL